MTSSPDEDFLKALDDPTEAKRLVTQADTSQTAAANRAHVVSQLYMAHKTKIAGETLAASVTSLAEALERALGNHAQALQRAAAASERYAKGLNMATWALVLATVGLVVVELLKAWKGH